MKKLVVMLVVVLACMCGVVSANTDEYNQYKGLDLSDYTDEQLGVYENSRVTDIKEYGSKIIVSGYAFVKNVNCNHSNALWREIIFINADNPSPDYAYRQQVNATNRGKFLTTNTNLNPNGVYDYNYATYTVTVDTNNIQNYKKTKTGAMANGDYYVYIRVSDGKHGKLFPLQNVTLSDGTSLNLSDNFSKVDESHKELKFTKKNSSNNSSSSSVSTTDKSINPATGKKYTFEELIALGYSDIDALTIMGYITDGSTDTDNSDVADSGNTGSTGGSSSSSSGGTYVPVSSSGLLKEVISDGSTEGYYSNGRYYIGHNHWRYDLTLWTEEEVYHMEHCVMLNEVEACNFEPDAYYVNDTWDRFILNGKVDVNENITTEYYNSIYKVEWSNGDVTEEEVPSNGYEKDYYDEFTMSEDKIMSYARQYYNDNRSKYKEMLTILNEIRAENGVAPVELDDELCVLATARSVELAYTNYEFKHERPAGRGMFDTMLINNGYKYKAVAENIAASYADVSYVMNGWKNSSGHFQNMIDPDMNTVGFGYVEFSSGYQKYWTTLLVEK